MRPAVLAHSKDVAIFQISNQRWGQILSGTIYKCDKNRNLHSYLTQSFKLGFNKTWTEKFEMSKLDFEEAEEPEIKMPTSVGSSKKQESSRKTSASALLTTPKPLTVWFTTNYGKFLRRCEYQTTLPASWEICMQVKRQQLKLDMEQQTGSKLGKEYVKAVYCQPAYLSYMQGTSCKMPTWLKHKLKSRLLGEISITSAT